jgi:hypothetical protein
MSIFYCLFLYTSDLSLYSKHFTVRDAGLPAKCLQCKFVTANASTLLLYILLALSAVKLRGCKGVGGGGGSLKRSVPSPAHIY